jgi:hypothetical protein
MSARNNRRLQQLAAIYQQKILQQIDALPQKKTPTKQRYLNGK